jgi:hypothetical protein
LTRYLIHNLRLTYLRHVEDPFGSRIITVNPNYGSNAYIAASGLADPDRWPELNMSSSTAYEEDEKSALPSDLSKVETHSAAGFPFAQGLKYTRTIRPNTRESTVMKNRRNRSHSQKESEPLPPLPPEAQSHAQRNRSDSAPDPVLNGTGEGRSPKSSNVSEKRRSIAALSYRQLESEEVPQTLPRPFKPPFARAAEMEVRRRARMRRRARQAKLDAGLPVSSSDAETSSDSDALSPDSDFEQEVDEDET